MVREQIDMLNAIGNGTGGRRGHLPSEDTSADMPIVT
jgi:hypothetical protein